MGRARLLQPEGRADYGAGALVAATPRQNLQKLFPIMSFGKLYEAGNPGAQQGVQGVCKAKAWQNGRDEFLRRLDRGAF